MILRLRRSQNIDHQIHQYHQTIDDHTKGRKQLPDVIQLQAEHGKHKAPDINGRTKHSQNSDPDPGFSSCFSFTVYLPVMTVMTSNSSWFRVLVIARPSSMSTLLIRSPLAQTMRLVLPSASSCTAS